MTPRTLVLMLIFAATPLACSSPPPPPPPTPSVATPPGPTAAPPREIHSAVGDTSGLSADLQRAFDARSPDFLPIAEPGPNDWLANHKERGQSFRTYLWDKPNPTTGKRKVLYVQPIGSFDHPLSPDFETLEAFTEAYFGLPCTVLEPLKLEGITSRVNPDSEKRQLLTTDILVALGARLPEDAYALVGLTWTDLYPEPSWNFVFGQATFHDRVGVYSFARYDPAFYGDPRGPDAKTLILRRSLKIMAHELGHMFSLEHCVHFTCGMQGSNNLDETDAHPMHLCPVCARKLHHTAPYDPAARYEKLAAFYRAHGLAEEATWAHRRMSYVRGEPGLPK